MLGSPEFRVLSVLILVTLAVGTLFYNQIEGWRVIDSLYFSVITLTTVGYGDLYPHTDAGKIFTMVFIFVGIVFILMFFNYIARYAHENALKEFLGKKPIPKKMAKKLEKTER